MEIRSLYVSAYFEEREKKKEKREIKLKSNAHSVSSCLLSRRNVLTGFAVCAA